MDSSLFRNVVVAVRFWKADPWGNGGTKRSAQIDEAVLKIRPDAQILEVVLPISLKEKLGVKTLLALIKHRPKLRLNFRLLMRGARDIAIIKKAIDEHKNRILAVVWEATPSFAPAITFNVPVLAFPHNIEALSATRKTLLGSNNPETALAAELAILRCATKVIAISNYDAVVLKNAGIDSDTYTYHPTLAVSNHLGEIRAKRRRLMREGSRYLILGSATNPVTAQGMHALLTAIKQYAWKSNVCFSVCGSGTDQLQKHAFSRLDVLGRVSDEHLSELLVQCQAAIIYQTEGSGLLTRIQELTMAGVPVIANAHAARGYAASENLTVRSSLEDIMATIDARSYAIPNLDDAPVWMPMPKSIISMLTQDIAARREHVGYTLP